MVWDLLYLPDGTLVSADSDGAVQFWDGRFGTLLQRWAGALLLPAVCFRYPLPASEFAVCCAQAPPPPD